MLLILALSLLFFLPIIESFDRNLAFNLLLIGSLFLGVSTFWRKRSSFDFYELLMLLMLLIFTLSTTLSWSISKSYIELLRYFAYFLIFVSVRRFPNTQYLMKRFYLPMIIINSVILSILYVISTLPIFKLSPPANRMSLFYPVFGHNRLSDILLFTLPIMISLISSRRSLPREFSPRGSNSNIIYYIGTIFFTIVFILTMARGAMLSLTFALFIYFFFVNRDKHWNPWILVLSSVTAIFLIVSFIFSNFLVSPEKGKLYPKFIYKNVASENRPIYFQQALDNFISHPIFGTGLDTFRYASRINSTTSSAWTWYVHNHFLQIFTETGFLGGLLFTFLIILLLIRTHLSSRAQRGDLSNILKIASSQHEIRTRNDNQNSLRHGLFIAVLASSIHSLIDFDWQFISIFLIFWVSIALLIPKTEEKDRESKNFLWFSFVVIISALYSLQLVIPLDIEKLLAKGDKASVLQAYRLDTKNIDIVKKLAQLEAKAQNYNQAHYWYRMVIFLAPNESFDSIKQDSLLYLAQIKKAAADKNINLSLTYLKTLAEAYPFYFQISSGDYYLVNAYKMNSLKDKAKALLLLKEYTNIAQRKISGYKLNSLEIQAIIDNLQKVKTIY